MTNTAAKLSDYQRAILRWVVDGDGVTNEPTSVPFRSFKRIAGSLMTRGLITWTGRRYEATETGLALDPPDQV
jgi:hypothetical protein